MTAIGRFTWDNALSVSQRIPPPHEAIRTQSVRPEVDGWGAIPKENRPMNMTNSTESIDFGQIRAERAAAIVDWSDSTDDYNDDLIDTGCATCPGDAGPSGLCEDCHERGAHVAGPSDPVDVDAIRSYPTVGPETVAALCDEVERLRDDLPSRARHTPTRSARSSRRQTLRLIAWPPR
ncbi:hypothetical protein GCM10029992_12330 [Glycomyces albus]